MQQKYSFTSHNKNSKARCKKYLLFVKMTIPICVNRKCLRMKSTAKQEINRNFKKNSFIPLICIDPGPAGSATIAYFFIQNCFKCDYDHHNTEYCCIWQRTNNFVT